MEINMGDIFSHYKNKPYSEEKKLLENVYSNGGWSDFYKLVRSIGECSMSMKNEFHLIWVERGHFIRNSINNDTQLLQLLRLLLPPYTGEGMILYRGENIERYNAGRIGFCWTPQQDKAKEFARGLNSYKFGGVLLRAWFSKKAVLAGIHPHSQYLGEYEITVDGSAAERIYAVEEFPPSH